MLTVQGGPKKRGLSFLSPNNILKGAQVYSFQFLKGRLSILSCGASVWRKTMSNFRKSLCLV